MNNKTIIAERAGEILAHSSFSQTIRRAAEAVPKSAAPSIALACIQVSRLRINNPIPRVGLPRLDRRKVSLRTTEAGLLAGNVGLGARSSFSETRSKPLLVRIDLDHRTGDAFQSALSEMIRSAVEEAVLDSRYGLP